MKNADTFDRNKQERQPEALHHSRQNRMPVINLQIQLAITNSDRAEIVHPNAIRYFVFTRDTKDANHWHHEP